MLPQGYRVGCSGKRRYASEAQAWKAIRKTVARPGPRFRAYRCIYCHQWHIGKAPVGAKQAGSA